MRRKNTKNSGNSQHLEEVGAKIIDKIEQSRTFEPWNKPVVGTRIFIFKNPGDFIQGRLGAPVENFRRTASYPIEQEEDGEVVEIFGTRLLHKLIKKYELIGQWVRIVYIGRQITSYGMHARKIYRIYKISGCFTESHESLGTTEQIAKSKKRKERSCPKKNRQSVSARAASSRR